MSADLMLRNLSETTSHAYNDLKAALTFLQDNDVPEAETLLWDLATGISSSIRVSTHGAVVALTAFNKPPKLSQEKPTL